MSPHAPATAASDRSVDVDARVGPRFDVVVPTVGRDSLAPLLDSLGATLPAGSRIIVADDRRQPASPLLPADSDGRCQVVASGGRGPAAARNTGWRASTAPWVVFVDDDVVLSADWMAELRADISAATPEVAAVQGRIRVPQAAPGTDWQRNVAGLDGARWVTADMAVRRAALVDVDGFDERFPRAYREDTDLALRLLDGGWQLALGERTTLHPVRPAPWWVSVSLQRGNADDVVLERLHGRRWRERLGTAAPAPGAFRSHRTTTAAGVGALLAAATGRRRIAAGLLAWWAARTARFGWARIAPGPRTPAEVAAMVATSIAIPPAACFHRLRGHVAARR
jgi:glycosyltransferase involved in cell wall biosynthesis